MNKVSEYFSEADLIKALNKSSRQMKISGYFINTATLFVCVAIALVCFKSYLMVWT